MFNELKENENKRNVSLLPYKQRVGGSNPSAPTLKIKGLGR
jgi:hypothetical protein